MSKIVNIIKKNFKLLARSRSSALIVIFGPIFITLLVGLAFNTSGLYDIKVGTYSSSYSTLTDSLIEKLQDQEFRVIKTSSEENCIEKLKLGEIHICLIFPPNLVIEEDVQNEITFYVDYSKINLAWIILDIISSKVSKQASELSLELTQDIVSKLRETQSSLNEQQTSIENIKTSSEEIYSKSGSLLEDINSLDLSFQSSSLNISAIEEEIDNIESEYNLSASDLTTLLSLIESLKTNLTNLDETLTQTRTVILSTETQLSDFKTKSSTINVKINTLNTEIQGINENINSLKVTNATTIVSPITTEIKPITSQKTNLDFVIPTLIVLIIMFIAVLLSSTLVMSEKTSKAHFRNYITPTRDIVFILGTFLTGLIIMILQLIIFLAIANFFLKSALIENLFPISVILLIISTLFVLVGMLIGYLFNSEETAIIASISFSSIALFFSSTVLPLESMPTAIQKIAFYNPFVIGQNILRKAMIFQTNLKPLVNEIYYLLAIIAFIFILTLFAQKSARKKI